MSLFGRIMESMRLSESDDDGYFLDDDYEEDDRPPRKSLFGKKDDDYYDDEEPEETPKPRFLGRSSSSNKVVPMRRSMEVSMIRPTSIEDSKDICDYLLAGKTVVLNMEGLNTKIAQRVIDFTSAATYSMNGNLHKISNNSFIQTLECERLACDFHVLLGSGRGNINMSGMNLRL